MTEKITLNENNLSYSVNDKGDRMIRGFAIHPGQYHEYIRINDDEITNATNSLKGAILLKDHNNSVDSAVGRVHYTETKMDPEINKYGTYYEASIDAEETDLIRKIDKGIVNSTSIGFSYEPICGICGESVKECSHWVWDDGFFIDAQNVKVHELSIVSIPADSNATVAGFSEELFSDDLVKSIEFKKENKNMTNLEEKYAALSEKLADAAEAHKAELQSVKDSYETQLSELKEEHDAKFSDKVEEMLKVKNDLKELQEKYDELSSSYDELQSKMSEIKEAELSELRDKVTELSEQVGAGLSEEEIKEFSEATLNRYLEIFGNIAKQNQPANIKNVKEAHAHYEDNKEFEEASPLEKLSMRLNK